MYPEHAKSERERENGLFTGQTFTFPQPVGDIRIFLPHNNLPCGDGAHRTFFTAHNTFSIVDQGIAMRLATFRTGQTSYPVFALRSATAASRESLVELSSSTRMRPGQASTHPESDGMFGQRQTYSEW